jgi:hypothetical protein
MTGLNGWAAAQSLAAKSTKSTQEGEGSQGRSRDMPRGQSATHSLGPLLCQDVQRQVVGLAVEVFEQGIFEDAVVGGSSQKQGHAGPEFEVVGISEDLLSAIAL